MIPHSYRTSLDRRLSAYHKQTGVVVEARKRSTVSWDLLTDAEEAQRVAQEVAAEVQRQAHVRIASVVTKCLDAVFGDVVFDIRFDRKRGKTEARLVFVVDGHEVDPMGSDSGGVVDIASLALRVARVVMGRPTSRRLIVLDEPFRFVNKELLPPVAKMLETLAVEFGIQFILVTQIADFCEHFSDEHVSIINVE